MITRIPYPRATGSMKLAAAMILAVAGLLISASAASAAGGVDVRTPSVDFGRVVLGAGNTVTSDVKLHNATSSTLQLVSMQLTGGIFDFTPSFANGTTCPTPTAGSSVGVAPDATCTVRVTYSPSTLGPVSGVLNMSFCSAGDPSCATPITTSDVSLRGDGVHAETLTLAPAPLSFASTPLATSSAPQTVTLTNGSETTSINGLSLGGAAPDDFAIGNDGCSGATLAPGASCTFDVRFTPSQAGVRSATVTVAGATIGNSYPTLTLTGVGSGLQASPVGPSTPSTPSTPAAPAAPTGATGSSGADERAGGAAGQVELVTCRTVSSVKGHPARKVKVQRCTARRVSGSVTFTATGATAHAAISRGRVVYASGLATSRGTGRWQLLIHKQRALRPGLYTLMLRTRHGVSRASLRVI